MATPSSTIARLRRRDAHRLAAGAGALAALAPPLAGSPSIVRAAPAAVTLAVAPLATPAAAENMGVNEAFRAMKFGNVSGAGWTRWTVQWFNMQPNPGDFNIHYFRDGQGQSILEAAVQSGTKVAAMVLGTPEWAAVTPGLKTGTSVPRGLDRPVFVNGQPNPENPWGAYMFQLADTFKGLLDVFEIWNEVEIPTTGSNSLYHTWAGTPAEYYQLLKVASQAAKAANPNARIVTSPYAYFRDKEEGKGASLPWFEGFAAAVRSDPARASVFDVFALNLYRNAHDLWDRMHGAVPQAAETADRIGYRARLQAIGAGDKPIWVTEINSMPYDDPVPGWDPTVRYDYFRITLDDQASYILQAYAIGLAAGYEKIFVQALQDDKYPVPDELWGLVRFNDDPQNDEPSRIRPAFVAYQLAAQYMGGADWSQLLIRHRPDPRNFKQYASRYDWGGHLGVFQKGARRAHVLWNGTGDPMSVSVQPWGVEAKVVNKYGMEAALPTDGNGYLTITLDPAARHFNHPVFGSDPEGYFYVGGSPLIIVEDGVPHDAPVLAPGFIPV